MLNSQAQNVFDTFSSVLDYPNANTNHMIEECLVLLKDHAPKSVGPYTKFKDVLLSKKVSELEELYTRTFDVTAICHLDVGYVLFGEDYKRGAFLVEMSQLLKRCGVCPGTELADFLPNILKVIPRMGNTTEKKDLIKKILIPAVSKMEESFQGSDNEGSSYKYALKSVNLLLLAELNHCKKMERGQS